MTAAPTFEGASILSGSAVHLPGIRNIRTLNVLERHLIAGIEQSLGLLHCARAWRSIANSGGYSGHSNSRHDRQLLLVEDVCQILLRTNWFQSQGAFNLVRFCRNMYAIDCACFGVLQDAMAEYSRGRAGCQLRSGCLRNFQPLSCREVWPRSYIQAQVVLYSPPHLT